MKWFATENVIFNPGFKPRAIVALLGEEFVNNGIAPAISLR
ncbi:MAG TPA: hypothetical protein VGO58_06935 [Chitinophagaceae bacterium]|nr:hypothetical protein [Chitinophagaceae bacterium]